MDHSHATVSGAGDGSGKGVIRAASSVYITQCHRRMATGRDTERKSDSQERFRRASEGITIHFICAVLYRALLHAQKYYTRGEMGRRWESKNKDLVN